MQTETMPFDERGPGGRQPTGNLAGIILGEVRGVLKELKELRGEVNEHRADFAEHDGRDEARHAASEQRFTRLENQSEATGRHQLAATEKSRDKTTERVFQFIMGIVLTVLAALGGYYVARK